MKAWHAILLLVLLSALGCASIESVFDKDEETEVPLSEVPQVALDAAKAAVPGIVLTEAEVEEEDGQMVYELEGAANGQEYEIEVTADGKVLETDTGDEDDDGEDDNGEDKD